MLISIRETFAGAEGIVPFIHQNEYEVTGKSEEEYMQYAALVNMDKEIQEMPEGIHTSINSDRISTGQRQRLSICMVLLRDMPFAILDEPVSNLDIANSKLLENSEKTAILTVQGIFWPKIFWKI